MEKKSEYTKMKGSTQLESGWMRRSAFWKMEVIIILMLTGFAFFINRHMKLECLYMDDLYQWYCYNDQSFGMQYLQWEAPGFGFCIIWFPGLRWLCSGFILTGMCPLILF